MGSRRVAMTSAAGMLAVAVLVSGCTTVVPSVGIADPRGNPYGAIPDMLEPGLYPSKPGEPLGKAGNAKRGAAVEARRMGEAVVVPFEVNPALTDSDYISGDDALILTDDVRGMSTFSLAFGHTLRPTLLERGLISGFASNARASFQAGDSTTLTNGVLRFATDQAAADAVTALAGITAPFSEESDGGTFRPLPAPGHPGTQAIAASSPDSFGKIKVNTYTAAGPFVLAQAVSDKADAASSLKLALETLDKQRAALDSFTPTPVDQLAELPLDPTGLAAKTLPVQGEEAPVFGPHAMLNFTDSPDRRRDLFAQVGMTQAAFGSATVYETRDASAAARFAGALAGTKTIGTEPYVPAAPVPGMLAARCMTPPGGFSKRVYCVAPAGRYAIEVDADGEKAAHQQLAAQYLMLTAS